MAIDKSERCETDGQEEGKRLQELLREAADEKVKHEGILSAIGDGITVQNKDFAILYQNRAHKEMLGDHVGKQCYAAYGGKSEVCPECPVAQVFKDGLVHNHERVVGSNGDARYFEITASPLKDSTGEITSAIKLVRDVTSKRKTDKEVALRKAEFEAIFDAISDALIFVDAERRIITVNPAFKKIFGYETYEVVGKTTEMLYADVQDFHRKWKSHYRVDVSPKTDVYEVDYRRRDGSVFTGESVGSHVHGTDGDVIGFLGVVRDITDRKEGQIQKERMEEQLRHVQKLESLGVLAGGIAHDFNNLLMAILGNADLALLELSPVSPIRSNLEAIERASRRAAELCKQMLAYSGKGKFVIMTLDINEVLREMNHMLEVSISKKAVLKYNYADMLPPIKGDASQLRQIVVNLVINASEAIGEKSGIISVSTGAMDCDRSYMSETYLDESLPEGTYSYVEVSDTGTGMDSEIKAKIFDPFFSTKFTGRGLGMSAVLGIVRGHNGVIKVYSEKGRGTTVKVLFPTVEGFVHSLDDKTGGDAGSWKGHGTILLVDDEETILSVGKQMLEHLGFDVITAADGLQGLNLFRERHEDISCVLLDLSMPHLDGEQAYREMRRIDSDVRVIMSSGYNEQEVTQQFVGKGLSGFIQKPYQLKTLRDALIKILGN